MVIEQNIQKGYQCIGCDKGYEDLSEADFFVVFDLEDVLEFIAKSNIFCLSNQFRPG
jgi:hypothetical protein